jgi:16S rRNA (uracil1498-N3)-methyltransferase
VRVERDDIIEAMRNLFLSQDCIKDGYVSLKGDRLHYLKHVRRVKPGDKLQAVIGNRCYSLLVESVGSTQLLCSIEHERAIRPSDHASITVYQGLLKGSKMDKVVSRLAELGVLHFVPVITERSVPSSVSSNRIERWKRLAAEGVKVTGFEDCMSVSPPLLFRDVLKSLNKDTNRVIILFCVEHYRYHLLSYLQSLPRSDGASLQKKDFHLVFGPEGGFSLQEVEYASSLGGAPVTMGPFVLTSDTAVLVATGFIRLYCAY